MKLIYVAGPYRADSFGGIELNIMYAQKAAKKLWKEGWAVLTPHLNTAHFDGVVPDKAFLEGTKEMLTRCDAIYLLSRWTESQGAISEYRKAKELGLEIYYEEENSGLLICEG